MRISFVRSLAIMAVISGGVCVGGVSARLLVLDKPPLIEKTKRHIQQQVKKYGIPFLQKTYQQFSSKKSESKNLLVRRQLDDLERWMKQEYALSDTERTTTPIRKEQVFLTKEGRKMVRRGVSFGILKGTKKEYKKKSLLKKTPKQGLNTQRAVAKKRHEQKTITSHIIQKEKTERIKKYSFVTNNKNDWYNLKNGRINITTLRDTWISRVNAYRKSEGVAGEIILEPRLYKTATERSYKMRSDKHRSHKRFANSAFYDYKQLVDWFKERGIIFKNIHRTTFTENVGQGYLACNSGDCTSAALKSLHNTFNYFIGEKGTSHDAHRRTIVQPYFKIMGFGIAVDENNNTFYSTMHYGTEIVK